MPDTKKFPQPATAPDGLANALPDVPVCDPDCHGEPDIVARLRSDLPDDEVLYDLSELFRVFGIPPASRSCTRCLRANCA